MGARSSNDIAPYGASGLGYNRLLDALFNREPRSTESHAVLSCSPLFRGHRVSER